MTKEWANRGFEDPNNYGDYGGGGGGEGSQKTFSFFIPAPDPAHPKGITKRILFLDTVPFAFWEHSLYKVTGKSKDKAICIGRSGIDPRGCPLCKQEFWPSYVGYLTVIDMGTVVGYDKGRAKLEGFRGKKDRIWQFDKKLLCAKRGGDDKPGMLKKLERYREKYGGDLTGCVFDVTRTGKLVESCGDEWDYVERVRPEDFMAYLESYGAERSKIDLAPCDYYAEFTPPTYDHLARIVGQAPADGGPRPSGDNGARSEGAGYDGAPGGAPGDDDIPF